MRNALAHAGKSGRRVVSAFIATAFAQETPETAQAQWRSVADQLRPTVPKLAALMDSAEEDVLAYMTLPAQHRTKLHSNNPIERLNGEIKRRTDVVGIFPNEEAITRLVGAILLEQKVSSQIGLQTGDRNARATRDRTKDAIPCRAARKREQSGRDDRRFQKRCRQAMFAHCLHDGRGIGRGQAEAAKFFGYA